ncbi:MAG: YlxR family protein [Clostridiales bacterium]|nr:YlxR family protein [Clostridiales bacterium]
MKHIPLRSCIVCRQQKEKSDLLRVVRAPDGTVVIDLTGKASGRGAYVCKSGDCMHIAVKKRALNRAYKQPLSDEVYEELEKAYENVYAGEQRE